MGQVGNMIANTGKATLWYAERLLTGIDASDFGRLPTGASGVIETNHPAFIIGHLSIYPAWLLEALGVEPGAAAVPASYRDLFGQQATCRPDPEGRVYPGRDELVQVFLESSGHLFGVLVQTDDAAFTKENPHEKMRDFFPTVGDLVDFIAGAHAMGHLGQLSAWRRCMGLGAAM